MSDTTPGEMSLSLETLKGVSAKMIQAVLGFIGAIIFARVLGPKDFGGFYLLFTLQQLADRPLAGIGTAAKKRYSEIDAPRDEILGCLLIACLFATGVAGVGAVLFEDWLTQFTGMEEAAIVFVVLFSTIVFFHPFQQLLAAKGLVGLETWNDTLRSVLTLPLQLGFVALGFGAAGMGYGLAAATLLTVPVIHYFLRVRPTTPSRETVHSLWTYARYSIVTRFIGKTFKRLDLLLLGWLVTTGAAGYYEAAFKLTVPASFIALIAGSGLMVKVSNLDSRGEAVADHISNTVSFVSILAVPMFFGTLVLSEELIVTAFGAQYQAGAPLLIGLAFYQVVATQSNPYRNGLNGLDLPDLGMKIDLLVVVVNLAVGIAFTLEFGAIGVVVATILAESLRYLLCMVSLKRRVPELSTFPRLFFEQVLAGFVMFGVVTLARTQVMVNSWLSLGLLVCVGAVTYGVVLLALSAHLRLTVRAVVSEAT